MEYVHLGTGPAHWHLSVPTTQYNSSTENRTIRQCRHWKDRQRDQAMSHSYFSLHVVSLFELNEPNVHKGGFVWRNLLIFIVYPLQSYVSSCLVKQPSRRKTVSTRIVETNEPLLLY